MAQSLDPVVLRGIRLLTTFVRGQAWGTMVNFAKKIVIVLPPH